MNELNTSARVLITGGTGFAGSHLVEALLEAGFQDIHVTTFSGENEFLAQQIGAENIHQLDLTNLNATKEVFRRVRPDQIYHLAALAFVGKSFDEADRVLQNNITLQQNVLLAIRDEVPSARMLVVGSAEEYGVSVSEAEIPYTEAHPFRPINPYAVSKVTQDMLAYSYFISYKLDIVTVRPFNHIGERQSTDFAIPAFAQQIVAIENGEQAVLRVGDLSTIRDFTDVKDTVKAYILAMSTGVSGEAYNIGSGKGYVMKEMVDMLARLSPSDITIEVDQSRMRPHDIPKMIANIDKIKQLGWQPTIEISDTLKRVLEWYRNNK